MDRLWTPWRMSYIKKLNNDSNTCVFCKKINADDKEELVLRRGQRCYAGLNAFPYSSGHILIVPYRHVDSIEALSSECLGEMMELCKESLKVLRLGFKPCGFNVGFNLGTAAGAGLPKHVHMHVVPRWTGDSTFLSVIGSTRILPELLKDSWQRLRSIWDQEYPVDG